MTFWDTFDNFWQFVRIQMQKYTCRVHGALTLNKVAGNFHVTAGKVGTAIFFRKISVTIFFKKIFITIFFKKIFTAIFFKNYPWLNFLQIARCSR